MKSLTLSLLSLAITTAIFAGDVPASTTPRQSQASQSKIYFTRGKKGTRQPTPRQPTKVPKKINPYKYINKRHK